MLSKWNYHVPVELQFGRGRVGDLGRLTAESAAARGIDCGTVFSNRVMLVGYRDCPPLERSYKTAAASLCEAGFSVEEFMQVVPEPDEEIARRGAEIARRQGCGIVVGLGGGSVIDTAKGIAALALEQNPLWNHATANRQSQPLRKVLPIVAVPTTAGTGAEATATAVFKLHGVGPTPDEPIKALISGPALMPMLAVVDPDFFDTMPRELAAACGADAISHSLELVTSRLAAPVSTAMGAEALRLLLGNLATAVGRETNVDSKTTKRAREAVTLATTLSGMAVSGPGVTAAHALSHALGAILDVPHGKAVALATLPFLRFNATACTEAYAQIAWSCGLTSVADEQSAMHQGASAAASTDSPDSKKRLAQRLVERVERLWQTLELPCRLEGIDPSQREELIERLARNAAEGTPLLLRNNARKLDRDSLERIIAEIV